MHLKFYPTHSPPILTLPISTLKPNKLEITLNSKPIFIYGGFTSNPYFRTSDSLRVNFKLNVFRLWGGIIVELEADLTTTPLAVEIDASNFTFISTNPLLTAFNLIIIKYSLDTSLKLKSILMDSFGLDIMPIKPVDMVYKDRENKTSMHISIAKMDARNPKDTYLCLLKDSHYQQTRLIWDAKI
jgi:hypothetical protein